VSFARALVLLAAGLLLVPGLWVIAKGLAAIRRRDVLVQGKRVGGARAILAGLVLLAWGTGMIGFAVLVLMAQRPR
jgi:hypothetical protein